MVEALADTPPRLDPAKFRNQRITAKGERRAHVALRSPWDLGPTLADASGEVWLNHPHCAKFCVLGGATCSRN